MTQIAIRGEVDERAREQLARCAEDGNAPFAALCADGHVGYSQPIGGVVGYQDFVSPSGVGYDIACGNKAVATNLLYSDISSDISGIMDEIWRRISFGMGMKNNETVDHQIIDQIRTDAPMPGIRALVGKAHNQLGTVGGGNHYVDLFREEGTDRVWIGVHFGSRGFGHTIATGFLALAQGKQFDEKPGAEDMDGPPVLFHRDSPLAHNYIEAMKLAGDYAYAGRDVVCLKVLEILGAESVKEVHNHHNFAWLEEHEGMELWVVRKGATPAWPGQEGFVGATMGETSVILEGIESENSAELLSSTVHGAGRVMSRTQAAGKQKTVAECTERDCENFAPWGEYQEKRAKAGSNDRFTLCPDHPEGRMKKQRRRVQAGLVDYPSVRERLKRQGIELRGGGADEAPEAYKRLDEVLAFHSDTIRVTHRLVPVGIAMAGPDVPADD